MQVHFRAEYVYYIIYGIRIENSLHGKQIRGFDVLNGIALLLFNIPILLASNFTVYRSVSRHVCVCAFIKSLPSLAGCLLFDIFPALVVVMEPVAIIGFSFRLPQGAEDEDTFWDILKTGKNVMTPWPESRVNIDAFYRSNSGLKNTVSLFFFFL